MVRMRQEMALQMLATTDSDVAERALVGLDPRVGAFVSLHLALTVECFAAQFAHLRPKVCMRLQVALQSPPVGKLLVAYLA